MVAHFSMTAVWSLLWAANDIEGIEAEFDGVLVFFQVELVLGFLGQHEQFFGGLDVGGITALKLVTGIVDIFFGSISAVLGEWEASCGACMRSWRVDVLLDELVGGMHLGYLLSELLFSSASCRCRACIKGLG